MRHVIFVVSKYVAVDGDCQVIAPDPSSVFDYERVSTKWAKLVLTNCSWKTALTSAGGVCGSFIDVYRTIEHISRSSRSLDLLFIR